MSRPTRRLTAAALLTGALAVPAVSSPAVAADGTTTGTVNLIGGALAISAPATATASGSAAEGTVIDLALGQTDISDTRTTLFGWTVTATATPLTAPGGGATRTIPLANMVWSTGQVTAVTGQLQNVSAGAGGALSNGAVSVAQAAVQAGGGTYRYNPKITVTVPAGLEGGAYTTSIVQTVS